MQSPDTIFFAIFATYFMLGGLATTNILRLTKGNTLPVISSKCFCDSCGAPITPFFQLPIISYILCLGKCRNCKAKIPVYPLVLEIVVFLGMSALTLFFRGTPVGVKLSFLFYELVRACVVLHKGKREKDFAKQYLIAILLMIPYYLVVRFFVCLEMVAFPVTH